MVTSGKARAELSLPPSRTKPDMAARKTAPTMLHVEAAQIIRRGKWPFFSLRDFGPVRLLAIQRAASFAAATAKEAPAYLQRPELPHSNKLIAGVVCCVS